MSIKQSSAKGTYVSTHMGAMHYINSAKSLSRKALSRGLSAALGLKPTVKVVPSVEKASIEYVSNTHLMNVVFSSATSTEHYREARMELVRRGSTHYEVHVYEALYPTWVIDVLTTPNTTEVVR